MLSNQISSTYIDCASIYKASSVYNSILKDIFGLDNLKSEKSEVTLNKIFH